MFSWGCNEHGWARRIDEADRDRVVMNWENAIVFSHFWVVCCLSVGDILVIFQRFVCSFCDKTFAHNGNLLRHMMSHDPNTRLFSNFAGDLDGDEKEEEEEEEEVGEEVTSETIALHDVRALIFCMLTCTRLNDSS